MYTYKTEKKNKINNAKHQLIKNTNKPDKSQV